MKRILGIAYFVFIALTPTIAAQNPTKNPSGLAFTSVDHALVTAYEIDIVRVTDSTAIQTITISNAPVIPLQAGEVIVAINVQPVAFGDYHFVARALAGTMKSDNSSPSAVWQRAPGKPSGLSVR